MPKQSRRISLEERIERLEAFVHQYDPDQRHAGALENAQLRGSGHDNAGATEAQEFPSGSILGWDEFASEDLDLTERLQVVDAAIALLDEVFAHLPLKRAMLGIDPVQRLRLVRRRVEHQKTTASEPDSASSFHDQMIEIFHSVRDLHTVYFLPTSYHRRTAFLPFFIEEYFDTQGGSSYTVTKVVPAFEHPTFKVGVAVTHWNGIPIKRAVELNAAREAGSNDDARRARGIELLTLRPMSMSAPPDERWVVIGYDDGQAREVKFEWQIVVTHPSPNGAGSVGSTTLASAGPAGRAMGFDAVAERGRRVRTELYHPEYVKREAEMANLIATSGSQRQGPPLTAAVSEVGANQRHGWGKTGLASRFPTIAKAAESILAAVNFAPTVGAASESNSLLPEFFAFRQVAEGIGYIRIWSFMTFDANAFIAEFARIVSILSCPNLILDVRSNGGGLIWASEMLLQSLSTQRITPARFQFINTERTLELCQRESDLKQWSTSIDQSLLTSEVFSQGFPLTPPDMLANVSQVHFGKTVLIVDALSYSATDIFVAGFQDHNLGKVLGTSGRTGAGGANVVTYEFFSGLKAFPPLPKGVSFNVALRRSTRVNGRDGVPLEGLGVLPDFEHKLTRRDVLENNVDLINAAAQMFT